ncbi:MAG: FkbM family methyltransferase [Limnospira sp. PMC 894.15]|uniref:FkbM family methyltransferase n=1 Tax=Limnospira fusiformis PMC 851.14 TaxID=2219512 RepID=A0ABU9EMS9_LIMFS|nr:MULTISPECIES: FkbM family methyltransferase [unclassified Limnospira]MDT9187295.1 FkbM family methyltransferase [Limnospira sp. PMC 894.15]MDT9233900.1 FkbM family methyltransferase [Limnospira sp. PMC 917.15]MDT9273926.1 FkbM family methyltransferase [Limnospira sp. PMC 737.11]
MTEFTNLNPQLVTRIQNFQGELDEAIALSSELIEIQRYDLAELIIRQFWDIQPHSISSLCEGFRELQNWQSLWFLARVARSKNHLNLLDMACANVLSINPDFWFAREFPKHARGYYSQSGQEKIIEEFFRDFPPKYKFFVEVGAFDGYHYSNVRRLYEQKGWTGICIEPVRKNFAKLIKSYQNTPIHCIQAAIGSTPGMANLNVATYPHLPDWGSDVSSLYDKEMERWQRYGAVWEKETVSVLTLTQILCDRQVVGIDLLSIDTEGHDLEVLKGLDFENFKPRLIVIEYGSQRSEIMDFIKPWGYSVIYDNGQDLFLADIDGGCRQYFSQLTATKNYTGLTGNPPYEEIQTATERQLHEFLKRSPQEIKRVVIVGGYLGFEVDRLLANYPHLEIHIFEASPRYFNQLHHRFCNHPQVFCHHYAVSDHNGTLILYETTLDGCGSLFPIKTTQDHRTWIAPQAKPAEEYTVTAIRLDDFQPLQGKEIDLLWCDVQGAEINVLRGGEKILERCHSLFLEVWMYQTMYEGQCQISDLQPYLNDRQFYLQGIGLDSGGNGTGNSFWLKVTEGVNIAFNQPKIVGLVPAKNAEKIIEQCLRSLSYYTDAIVFLDDASQDNTLPIVQAIAGECQVEKILTKTEWYRDEPGDRNALLQAGRQIGGTHFIVLDADEMLTANCYNQGKLREIILSLNPGDKLKLNWIQLWRSVNQYRYDHSVWTDNYKDFIFCDDGNCAYNSGFIHTSRTPHNLSGDTYQVDEDYIYGVLHFQFVNWRNMLVKQAWYRCLELIRNPRKPIAQINALYRPSKDETELGLKDAPKYWFSDYPFFDETAYSEPEQWREKQVMEWFDEYGKAFFEGLDIWDINWGEGLVMRSPVFVPKVSAIISTYNSANFLRGCLQDLVNQTLYDKQQLEIIVIDSNSQENEAEIVADFQAKYTQIIYHRTEHRETLYAAWNRAIELAKGEYITNANTDDRHRFDALELMANYLDQHSDVAVVYGDQLITHNPNETFENTQANQRWNWPEFSYQELERRCCLGSQPMWRKSLHQKYGNFNPEFKVAGDYEFWLRIGKTENIAKIPEILGLYFDNQDGLENKTPTTYTETQKICQQYGITNIPRTISKPVSVYPEEIKPLKSPRKFHILVYTDEPRVYGVGQYNHSILTQLIQSGYHVSCVQSRESHYLLDQQKQLGIQHFWLDYDSVKDFQKTLTDQTTAETIFTKANPDLILFSDCCPLSNLAAKQVAMRLKIPFVITENFVAPYLAQRFQSYLGQLADIYQHSQEIIAVSQENLQQLWELFQLPKPRGRVIYYGRPRQYFSLVNPTTRDRIRQQLGIPPNAIVCFTSARLESIKGYQYQLQAIQQLKNTPIWCQLYFLWTGEGSWEHKLQTEIKKLGVTDQVKLLGCRHDIPDLLDASDIFILPSELEGMPLSVMEAMAKGLPIIASAVSGIPEELGNTGKLLSDPKINASATITELVETLEQWVANPHLRYNIGQACKQRAEQMFTEQQMLTKTIEVIKTALPTNLPLISVIIPCYQQAEFLPEAVASVVAQTYPNWEIIIVNDGSPDQTSQVAQHLIQIFANHKISLIATDNKGCASARNAGINQAKGEYILPLDADDKLSSSAIASLVEVALSKSHDCVIFGSYEIFGTEQRKIVTADQYSLENLKQYNMLVCTSLYSKNVYKLTNGYKEEIKESGYEDWEFWLNCHQHNIPFYGIRETVLYYRRHPRSRVVQSFQNRDYYKAQVMSYYPDLFDAKPQPVELILNASGDLNLQNFADYVQKYQQNPHDELALDNLRNARQAVADMWLKLETEQLPKAYQENLGQAHKSLLNSGIKNEIFRDDERLYFQEIKSYLSQGFKQPKTFQYLLAGMLYGRADQLMLTFEESLIPTWLAEDYFRFLFDVPPLFQEIGDADNYSRYRIRLLDFVRERLQQQPDYPLWQKLTTMLLERGNFIPNYFADFNLKPLFCSRAELFHLFLQSRDFQLDYSFPEPPSDRQKIRLGILNDHLNPQTETYLTLPAFEYLNREQFEIILYVTQANNHPLEQYCRSRADRLVRLPDDKLEQAATIRADNLDILLFGTNVTAITKPVTLLALHRLARVQATLFSSPVTTGMRYIDYYISGHLSEGAEAPNFYRENLAVLNGTGFCFNYYAIAPQPATVKPHRSQWGANDQTIVFMSGANFYKIIPEQGETWVKILAQVPNSILVLYPFAPSWSNNYASSQFIRRMHATLSKYGVAEKRLVLIKTLPSRTDVKACLEQGDIYLDSYPHSGSNSLVDPLEVGLPVVVRDGDTLRSKHGAAMMRSLGIPDLITDDESSYISLAVTLANTPELLQLKRQAIQQKMAANPEFLDSRAYGAKMGALLTQIFQNYQSKHQVIDLDNPQKQQRFLSELVDQVNLYELDPTNTMVVNKLHTIRRGMVEYWLRQPAEQLETLYQQQIGKGYQILLNRGLKKEPLNDEEKALVNHWTKTAMGLTEPHAINCLMAVMLYSQPGKMLVRDAVNRLPAWLLPDYQRVFENADAIAQIKQTLATTKTQSTPVNSPQVTPTVTAVDVSTFVNRLIGCVKLFKIDPTDTNITVELRQLRWQFAQFWLNLPEHKLEEMYQSPLGDGYRSLLNSRLQNEMLTQHEWDFLQQVGTYLRQGLDTPRSLNYLIAAMLYYRPEQLQIQDLSRLPSYLQRDYQNWQNPLSS